METLQNQETIQNNNTNNNTSTNPKTQQQQKPIEKKSEEVSITTTHGLNDKIAFDSLIYDNPAMRTSQKAAQCYYGILSDDNISNMVNFLLNGSETVPANPELISVNVASLGTDYVSGGKPQTGNGTIITATTSSQKNTKSLRMTYTDGGYKFMATDEGMSGLISKRLENDLGQQTQGANYVFRSNDYVSIDVAARLAIDGKSRVCRTLEVINELYYNMYPTVSPFSSFITQIVEYPVFIFDYEDYNTSALQQWLDKIPNEQILVVNETKPYDAVAAIGRMMNSNRGFNNSSQIMIFFLSNCRNPLRSNRCVINIDGYVMNDPSKCRFHDRRILPVICQRYLGLINIQYYDYSIAEINMDGTISGDRSFIQKTSISGANYNTVSEYDNMTLGTLIDPPSFGNYPMSTQKYVTKDIFTGLCFLAEYEYNVCTPHGDCDFALSKYVSGSGRRPYGIVTIPVCDWLIRVAQDKKIIEPIVNKTHKLNNRNVLAQKLKIFATFKAGRLLNCISEVFGSINNLARFRNLGLLAGVTHLIDAQNVGIYDGETLIGLVAHVPFDPMNVDGIYNIAISPSATGSYANGTTNTTDIIVSEYAPIASYWRVDLFGDPIKSDVNVRNERWDPNISAGFRAPDHERYVMATNANGFGYCSYRFDNSGGYNQVKLVFESPYNGETKLTTSGICQLPTFLWKKDTFSDIRFRPSSYGISTGVYPIMYSHQHLAQVYDNGSSDTWEDVLFA